MDNWDIVVTQCFREISVTDFQGEMHTQIRSAEP